MKKISITIFGFLLLTSSMALAEKAESFEQAKTMSADLGIPILLEFVHED
jgi:hypothetical protein